MYGRVLGVTVLGVGGHLVTVEAFVGRGLPSLTFTGLPGAAVQDARERIRPAVEHAGLEWPLRRVVVNLAPGNLRKEGPGLDLPIAAALLVATGQVKGREAAGWAFAGELSLKGELLPTPGVLSVAIAAARGGLGGVIVPAGERPRSGAGRWAPRRGRAIAAGGRGASSKGAGRRPRSAPAPGVDRRGRWRRSRRGPWPAAGAARARGGGGGRPQPADGGLAQERARRCSRDDCPRSCPRRTREEALEASQLHSVAGLLTGRGLLRSRPFRAPHHSISTAGLLGGGTTVFRPGEASLATHGVLFLDELTEFRRDAIEALRQPLEDGRVIVTRAAGSVEFPARFTLVAAANPCPCGYRRRPATPLPMSGPIASSSTARSCRGRCSTGSTCGSGCRG